MSQDPIIPPALLDVKSWREVREACDIFLLRRDIDWRNGLITGAVHFSGGCRAIDIAKKLQKYPPQGRPRCEMEKEFLKKYLPK